MSEEAGVPPVGRAVLLVEDDEGDAVLVREHLADADPTLEIEWVAKLEQALSVLPGHFDCVLFDLGLPDATGLEALRSVLDAAPDLPVIVLTGLAQEESGLAAVSVGAQDYLVKGQVDGQLLRRCIQYSVERKRAEQQLRRLHASELLAAENERLQWGLLPLPIVTDKRLKVLTRYQPGHEGVLGGDFFDVVETADGRLHVLVGDVAGHDIDEAALGVALRIAWRTLVLAGTADEDVLPILDKVVASERRNEETFATVCTVVVGADREGGQLHLAGHPSPLLLASPLRQIDGAESGPPLGLFADASWSAHRFELPDSWRLMLFTDGLIEGKNGDGAERLGMEGLGRIAEGFAAYDDTARLLDHLIASAQERNGGPLVDDVAAVVVECTP
ncbi:MAG TPA: SpoIIE family protein phosphatase [Mycobacteriales bacterium]|nr:SpoIIE family protein phosphatase [Mycobacteriales bacterium]